MAELRRVVILTKNGICLVAAEFTLGPWQRSVSATNELALRRDARAYLESLGADMISAHVFACPADLAAKAQFVAPTDAEMVL